jgi:hypothetical protein
MDGTSADPSSVDPPTRVGLSGTRYDAFVVRIHSEDADRTGLRGQITHVPTRSTAHFANPHGLLSFILRHLGSRPEPPASWP